MRADIYTGTTLFVDFPYTGCPPTFKMSFPCNLLKNVPFSMLMGLKNIPFSMRFSEKHTFFHANKSSLYVNFLMSIGGFTLTVPQKKF